LVERSSSAVIFLLTRTSTFAAKMVKTTSDEFASRRLIDSLGGTGTGVGVLRGVEDVPNPAKSDEKNPLAWFVTVFRASVLAEGFSEPTVYTHRTTSASM
jgi:hypothetical protein